MAVTKIHGIKETELKSLEYITNPEKTKDGRSAKIQPSENSWLVL